MKSVLPLGVKPWRVSAVAAEPKRGEAGQAKERPVGCAAEFGEADLDQGQPSSPHPYFLKGCWGRAGLAPPQETLERRMITWNRREKDFVTFRELGELICTPS